jgi:hypothetical protein
VGFSLAEDDTNRADDTARLSWKPKKENIGNRKRRAEQSRAADVKASSF